MRLNKVTWTACSAALAGGATALIILWLEQWLGAWIILAFVLVFVPCWLIAGILVDVVAGLIGRSGRE